MLLCIRKRKKLGNIQYLCLFNIFGKEGRERNGGGQEERKKGKKGGREERKGKEKGRKKKGRKEMQNLDQPDWATRLALAFLGKKRLAQQRL